MTEEEEKLKQKQAPNKSILERKEAGEELTQDEQKIYDAYKKIQADKNKSWFEKNMWWIAFGLAIFFLRMCSTLSKPQ